MGKYLLRRLLLLIPILFGVSVLVFGLIHAIPGDITNYVIGTDQRISPEERERVIKSYGLDQPLPVQYGRWMERALQGDLGTSFRTRREVWDELSLRMPVTMQLALMAATIAISVAIPVGVIAAVKRNSRIDYAATIGTLIGISMPNFLFATILVLIFSFKLKWLPPIGYVPFREDPLANLKVMLMPSVSLALPLAAVLMRYTRSAVLEALEHDHVRVARAKGLSNRAVMTRHVLRNASIPIITVIGIQFATLLGGTVIIESIFGLPGIGRYIYESISSRDYPAVLGVTLVIATIFVLISLFVDIAYAFMDPRLRYR